MFGNEYTHWFAFAMGALVVLLFFMFYLNIAWEGCK